MKTLKGLLAPFALLGKLLSVFSFCAHAGGIVGALAGLLFGLLDADPTAPPVLAGDLPWIALILAGLGLLVLLVVLGVWLRYDVGALFWPAVVNALLTSFLAVYLNAAIGIPEAASLIGFAAGILVGTLLCWICRVTRTWERMGARRG